MKRGFTLIELLAVIVILAIILLIAIPIIQNIQSNAEEDSNERSIEMYAEAVKNAMASYQLKENKVISGNFTSSEDGKTLTGPNSTLTVEYDGDVVCKTIEIYKDGTIYLAGCKVNEIAVGYTYGALSNHIAAENVRATTVETKTTGEVPSVDESGNIVPGSEFQIKVSDSIGWLRFFVLSNDEDYVNLIAEQNITIDGYYTSEPQDNDEWYETSSSYGSPSYGPQTAYTYLSTATSNWTNIPIVQSFNHTNEGYSSSSNYGYQNIITGFDNTTGIYMTLIKPVSASYGDVVTYENMRARLPILSEITQNTTCREIGDTFDSSVYVTCPLWMVNYLTDVTSQANGSTSYSFADYYYKAEDGKVGNTIGENYGYWTLDTRKSNSTVRLVHSSGAIGFLYSANSSQGVRPVITILKSDLLKVI